MMIDKAVIMKNYVEVAVKSGLRIQNIEMGENLAVHIVITDSNLGVSETAYIGFPENETIHKKQAKDALTDGGGIILGKN